MIVVAAAVAVVGLAAAAYITLPAATPPPPPPPPAGGSSYTVPKPTGSILPPGQRHPLPDAAVTLPDGSPGSLSSFKGRVVLLNFWATWCPPCIREMPALAALQTRLGGPDFAVVTVSQDRGGAQVAARFLAEHKLAPLEPYHDADLKAGRALGVQGLPTTILIDRDGREAGRWLGAVEWDDPAMVEAIGRVVAER